MGKNRLHRPGPPTKVAGREGTAGGPIALVDSPVRGGHTLPAFSCVCGFPRSSRTRQLRAARRLRVLFRVGGAHTFSALVV